jgi:tetratricopeptide (TPR) repeat protein
VTRPPAGVFTAISSGQSHACGLQGDGSITCWGSDQNGKTAPPAGRFTQVSAGYLYTCGLRADGRPDCWGHGATGATNPPAVTLASVDAGFYHACGLTPERAIVCWGWNDEAQDPALQLTRAQRDAAPRPAASTGDDPRYGPTCPYEGLGLIYLRQDRKDMAEDYLEAAVELRDGVELSKYLALAGLYLEQGRLDEAQALADRAMELHRASGTVGDPAKVGPITELLERIERERER